MLDPLASFESPGLTKKAIIGYNGFATAIAIVSTDVFACLNFINQALPRKKPPFAASLPGPAFLELPPVERHVFWVPSRLLTKMASVLWIFNCFFLDSRSKNGAYLLGGIVYLLFVFGGS